ncbi:hypothetical protein DPMN_191025 [Dreissena polymorpha]|uniref:Sorting nexin-17/31 FERM domain-containing protein n=1 Tax=Dreissena polymorpha TaxID=45954 RepID=A0A9D4BFK4_DREPO|nr:hypothetical protein DPMN_191025 [Dreissena polymorpha]
MRLARTLKHYGYMQFHPCVADYPQDQSHVLIAAGNRELSFRVKLTPDSVKEGSFKITRIRCWRITTTAILMSMCLEGMVEELIMKKQGKNMKQPSDRSKKGKRKFQ